MYEMSRVAENLSIQNCVNSTVYLVHKCREYLDLQKILMSRTAKIHREIAYIMYVRNVWICRKIEYPELRKFIRILRTLYMYRMSRFPGKFNIQSCWNSTENCVHYICTKIQFEIVYIIYVRNVRICRKIEYPELRKLNWKLCTLYARNFWISRKIEYPPVHIFNGKWCTLYPYGMSGFAEKLNILNCENSMGNCVHFICTKA